MRNIPNVTSTDYGTHLQKCLPTTIFQRCLGFILNNWKLVESYRAQISHHVHACSNDSARSNSLLPHRLQPSRCLYPWDYPVRNTGAGCHSLLQGTYLTQGSNSHLLHWQTVSLLLSHWTSLISHHKRSPFIRNYGRID